MGCICPSYLYCNCGSHAGGSVPAPLYSQGFSWQWACRCSPAQSLLDTETKELLVAAVEAAAELDLYNARCRRDRSGRHVDNLNKELVSKLRMTVLQVEDELFPERSYRRVQKRLQRESLARLKQAGGCEEAKKAGTPNRLRVRYGELMGKIDRLP